MSMLDQIFSRKLVPVVVLERATDASNLADALVSGGLPVAEVTFRTDAAEESIRAMSARGDIIVGAGTVLTVEQVDRAVDAGAQFLVSPGTNSRVIKRSQELGIPILPGAVTATEIQAVLDLGLDVVKFFPASTSGGAAAIAALAAPFRGVRFVPTGGVSASNLGDYLRIPAVAAAGGSWMVSPKLIAAGEFDQIRALTAAAVLLAQEVSK
ncbi:MAG: bifunctional 4-hydroxy-2-oxoglutarate aldolase/2-dehydro-3-deoxy-phosphogluconate aldolase [Scrofimicrobium sp.]